MSLYMMNKLMRAIEMSDAAVAAYVADPPAYVAGWLAGGAGPDLPADQRALEPAERAAFEARDFGELYRLGAHPYLLWHWVEATHIHETTWPELNARYKEVIAPHGYPSYVE